MAKVSAKSSKREIERKVSDYERKQKNFVWVSDVVHMDGIWDCDMCWCRKEFFFFFLYILHIYITSHIAHLIVAVGYMSMKILFIENNSFPSFFFNSLLSLLPNFPHFSPHISMSILYMSSRGLLSS
jgi:hypothetical protein